MRDPRIDTLHPITLDPSQRTWSIKHVLVVIVILMVGFAIFSVLVDLLVN